MTSMLSTLYEKAPPVVQSVMLTAYSYQLDKQRYGGNFQRTLNFLRDSQWWSEEQLRTYQNAQLQALVHHAYTSVRFYRDLFDQIGLKPADIESVDDLPKIPLLRKEDFKNNPSPLFSQDPKYRKLIKGHTSGTTGSPLDVWYDSDSLYMAYAALARHYEWAQCRLARDGDRIVVARGNVIVPINRKKPPYWRHNWYHNQLLLSAFHMSSKSLPLYIEKIRQFNPAVIDGYPSTLYVLAKYLKNSGQKLPLRAAITSSETLYDFQREVIEESFDCRVFDYYALAERNAFASECEAHSKRHLYMEYAITEIVDKDGNPQPSGTEGILVGTNLHNFGMPLLRYVTNDRTTFLDEKCSCGRGLGLMEEVTTKAEDTLTLADGRLISPSVLTHPFKPLHSIMRITNRSKRPGSYSG